MSFFQQRLYIELSVKLAFGAALALFFTLTLVSCGGDSPSATSQWYASCGDPVCRGYTPPTGIPKCTTEKLGATCATAGSKCDPMDSCNALYICTTSDPKTSPGGCPISRRRFKTEIQYLDEAGLKQV